MTPFRGVFTPPSDKALPILAVTLPTKPGHVWCFPEFTVKQITWLTNIIFIPRASPILFNFSWHCSHSHLSKGKTHALRLEILFYIIAVHANNKIEYIICVNFAWSNYTKCDHWKCYEGFFYFLFFPSCTRPMAQCCEQNVNVCARNQFCHIPTLNSGGPGMFRTERKLFFLRIKMDYR